MFRSLLELTTTSFSSGHGEKSRLTLPAVSPHSKALNIIGCVGAVYLLGYLTFFSPLPLTLDVILTISLAEYCRLNSSSQQKHALPGKNRKTKGDSSRNGNHGLERLDTIAAVVGFREDPDIFRRALESYRKACNCKILLVCVDGDAEEDQEMVSVFKKVRAIRASVSTKEVGI